MPSRVCGDPRRHGSRSVRSARCRLSDSGDGSVRSTPTGRSHHRVFEPRISSMPSIAECPLTRRGIPQRIACPAEPALRAEHIANGTDGGREEIATPSGDDPLAIEEAARTAGHVDEPLPASVLVLLTDDRIVPARCRLVRRVRPAPNQRFELIDDGGLIGKKNEAPVRLQLCGLRVPDSQKGFAIRNPPAQHEASGRVLRDAEVRGAVARIYLADMREMWAHVTEEVVSGLRKAVRSEERRVGNGGRDGGGRKRK